MEAAGKCSARRLSTLAGVSRTSAKKAIDHQMTGKVIAAKRGTKARGVGSRIGLLPEHHAYLYDLYKRKPGRPRDVYVYKMEKKYGISITEMFITRWFKNIGPFKGNLRETSLFPPDKDSPRVQQLRTDYLKFICHIKRHRRIVFADEKPMKDKDIYALVRRDPGTGIIPYNKGNANSTNRWNILSAVTIKRGVRSVEYLVFEESTDSTLFHKFVEHLVEVGTLVRGDIFVIDNCSVHMLGENQHLQENLFECLGILMVPLPPYHPELNPTELVFNTLLMRLRSKQSRSTSSSNDDFLQRIENELNDFTSSDAKAFYRKCGYNR